MNYLNKLEYIKIIQIIEQYCNTYLGKKQCNLLLPSFNYEEVNKSLNETNEALSLLFKKGIPPFTDLPEIDKYLKGLESSQILSIKAIYHIGLLLKNSRKLKQYYSLEEWNSVGKLDNISTEISEDSSYLKHYFSNIYSNIDIEKEIFYKILDENTLNDNASSKLSSIRRNKSNMEKSIKDKLLSIIHSPTYAKYLMEPVITIRNNRYVIPVKDEYRSNIPRFNS